MDFEYLNIESFIIAQRISECCPDLLYTVEGEIKPTLSVKNVGKHNLYNFCITRTELTRENTPYKIPLELKTNHESDGTTIAEMFYDKSVLPVGMCYSYNIGSSKLKYSPGDIVYIEIEVECQDAFGTMYTQKLNVKARYGRMHQIYVLNVKCDKPTVKRGEK